MSHWWSSSSIRDMMWYFIHRDGFSILEMVYWLWGFTLTLIKDLVSRASMSGEEKPSHNPNTHTYTLRAHACGYYGNCHNTSPCISHIIAWQMRAAEREKKRDGGLVWVSGWNRKKEKHLEGEKMKNRKIKERSEQVKGKEEKEWIIKEFMRGCNRRRGQKEKERGQSGHYSPVHMDSEADCRNIERMKVRTGRREGRETD